MDMQLDAALIKQIREQRAWSQGHLADLTELSLRTIQRIEKTGVASYDSAQALAAVFEIPLSDIRQAISQNIAPPKKLAGLNSKLLSAGLGAILTSVALLLVSGAQAQQVKLDVRLSQDEQEFVEFAMVSENGEGSQFHLDDKFRFEIIPTANSEGLILLAIKCYQNKNGDYQLISGPNLLVKDQEDAKIIFNLTDEQNIVFWITPSISL